MVKGGGGAAASSSSSSSAAAAAAAAAAMDAPSSFSGLHRSTHALQDNDGTMGASTSNAARDAWYTFDEAKLEEVMSSKPWLQE